VVSRRPVAVLVAIALLTALAAAGVVDPRSGALRLEMDASTASMLPDDDRRAEFYEAVRKRFGDDDSMLVVLASDDLFTRERLRQLVETTRRIQALPGVDDVLSLASAVGVAGDADGIEVGSPLAPIPEDLRVLRTQVLEHPLWAGTLVSRDGRAATLIVTFEQDERELLASGLPRRVEEVAREVPGDAEVLATGTAYVRLELTEAVLRDLRRLIPAVAFVLLLVLALTMRSLRGVVVPLATIGAAVTWTLGTLGWLGIPLTLVTAVLPPLLLTVGFAYALHVVTADAGARGEPLLDDVGVAVLFAGLTTAIGFLALLLSPIHAIREFGVLAALGIAYTVVCTLTLAPALCALLPTPAPRGGGGLLERGSERLARLDVRHRRAVIGGAAVLFVAGCAALFHVETGLDPIESFDRRAPQRVAFERIKGHLGGVSPLSVVLEAERGAFAEPATLRQLEEFAEWLRADPDVAHVTSVAELLRLLHGSLRGNPDAGLPESRRMARQLLLLGAGPEQRGLIDAQQRSVRLRLRARSEDSASLLPLIARRAASPAPSCC
jgi:predicted RND superfamily exporter protein